MDDGTALHWIPVCCNTSSWSCSSDILVVVADTNLTHVIPIAIFIRLSLIAGPAPLQIYCASAVLSHCSYLSCSFRYVDLIECLS